MVSHGDKVEAHNINISLLSVKDVKTPCVASLSMKLGCTDIILSSAASE